jgi:hypothetical protein
LSVAGVLAQPIAIYPPYAFTEHGAIMAANVLNSKQSVEMSVFVVRAFVKLRETQIITNQISTNTDPKSGCGSRTHFFTYTE